MAAGELPREAESDFPYEGQQLERLQGRCAHDAERKTRREVDTTPRGKARNPVWRKSGRYAGEPRPKLVRPRDEGRLQTDHAQRWTEGRWEPPPLAAPSGFYTKTE